MEIKAELKLNNIYIEVLGNFCTFCISTLNPFNYNKLCRTKFRTNLYKNTNLSNNLLSQKEQTQCRQTKDFSANDE